MKSHHYFIKVHISVFQDINYILWNALSPLLRCFRGFPWAGRGLFYMYFHIPYNSIIQRMKDKEHIINEEKLGKSFAYDE